MMTPELRAAMIAQIRRDRETLSNKAALAMDPCGRLFYEERVRDFQQAVAADHAATEWHEPERCTQCGNGRTYHADTAVDHAFCASPQAVLFD